MDSTTSTTLQFLDAAGNSLGSFAVPATPGTATFSFLGVVLEPGVRAARVRLITGQNPLAAGVTDALTDLVVMDDFLYAEPANPPGTGSPPPVAPGSGGGGGGGQAGGSGGTATGTGGRAAMWARVAGAAPEAAR